MIVQVTLWILEWYVIGLVGTVLYLPVLKYFAGEVTIRNFCRIPLYTCFGPIALIVCFIGYVIMICHWIESLFHNADFDRKIW